MKNWAVSNWRVGVSWLLFVGLETAAQISLKLAANELPTEDNAAAWIQALASTHWFQLSIACDVMNFFAWMAILRRHDLSLAIPISSVCYFATVAASTVLLSEPVHAVQVVGLAFVGVGIFAIVYE